MNDDFLNQHRRAPRPEFAARLYERIAEPMNPSSQPPAVPCRLRAGKWLATTTLLAGALFAVLLFPPARAFADGVWHQIQVGGYIFVHSATDPNMIKTQADAAKIEAAKTEAAQADSKAAELSTAQASAQAGFAVLTPSYLPAGYVAEGGWRVSLERNGVAVVDLFGVGAGRQIKMVQFKLAPGQSPSTYPAADAVNVIVRGHAGLWLPDSNQTLVWEENGITYSLSGDGTSLAEMTKVAEGMH
jgi:hypothetical protein